MSRGLYIAIACFGLASAYTARPGGGTFSSTSAVPAPKQEASLQPPTSDAEPKAPPVGNGYASVRIERSADGHFYTDAMVNGATIRFLIDTGATSVALSKDDAQRAGVSFSSAEFTDEAQTASGSVAIMPVTLDRVAIGPLEARDVQAAIVDGGMGTSLLGQSWLRRVGTVTINGDVMELR